MDGDRRGLQRRDDRLARHCRAGHRLAAKDDAYRRHVLSRLALDGPADDVWSTVPWVWAATLDHAEPPRGAIAEQASEAAAALREWLSEESTVDALVRNAAARGVRSVDLRGVLRAHPFADYVAWSLRKPHAA